MNILFTQKENILLRLKLNSTVIEVKVKTMLLKSDGIIFQDKNKND